MLISLKILVALSILILIIGMINPKWILFWMKQPDRLTLSTVAIVLFMASWTGIAKLTMKPKEISPAERERSVEESNELPLDRR